MVVEALDALANLAMDPGDQERVALVRDQSLRKHLEAVDVLEHGALLPVPPAVEGRVEASRPCAGSQLINTCEGALETLVG
ncbi:hypothetical protein D3C86_1987370 [compost metagenome]